MSKLTVIEEAKPEAASLPPVKMTASAKAKFKSFLAAEEQASAIRIGVQGGGCSGYQYTLNVVPTSSFDPEEDIVWEEDGNKFAVDIFSKVYLRDCEVDYVETLSESGFKFNNPNAKRGCGCGSSFST